jgi:hypothetical protein
MPSRQPEETKKPGGKHPAGCKLKRFSPPPARHQGRTELAQSIFECQAVN